MTLIMINSDSMGKGNDELGRILTASFLRKVWASDQKPDAIVFYNTGVGLLTSDSPALDALTGLAEAGVDMLACGTCVTFFNLKSSLRVGRISDMQEITSLLLKADKVVTV